MFTNQGVQTYIRPILSSPMRQQVRRLRQKTFSVVGPKVFWVAVGKVLLFFCPLLIVVNFWLSSSAEQVASSVREAEEGRYALMDENIKLRAERARMYSPESLDKLAASQLALHLPEKGQVARF
jgi:hypothetical protein